MKSKFLCVLTLMALLNSYAMAQSGSQRFGMGIHANLFSVPLSPESLNSGVTGVYAFYALGDRQFIRLGYEDRTLRELTLKQYASNPGLMLGVGYWVYQNPEKPFALEVSAGFTNAFREFSSFTTYNADLGLKFYLLNSFYVGTGTRLAHDQSQPFIQSPTNSLGWYWHIGFQFHLQRKSYK